MKRILKVLLAALALTPAVVHVGGSCLAASVPQTTDPTQAIRQQYAAINKQARRYRKIKKQLSGFSLEGGELTAYFDGSSIVKIVANHYGESGRALEEYYYQDGKLIFVFRRDQQYDKPLSGKVLRTQENRFYFQNDRLVRWLNENGRPVAPGTTDFEQKKDDYLKTSGKFLSGARSKEPTIEADVEETVNYERPVRFPEPPGASSRAMSVCMRLKSSGLVKYPETPTS